MHLENGIGGIFSRWSEIMETNKPLVSVIMPAYNAERFLETAVRSVMAQTVTDWELLVLDDGSQDSTLAIAQTLAKEDPRIRVLPNEANMGVAKTRNRGFDLCRGEYVALLDSDDLWHAEKLEKQLDLAERTGAELVYCSYGMVDEYGKKICEDFIVPAKTDFEKSLTKSVISCSTVLLARPLVDRYHFEAGYYHEDLVLWLQILRDGHSACGLPEVLAQYRIMEGTRASNKLNSAICRWKVYRQYLGFSAVKSAGLLWQYAVMGLKKYKRSSN